MNRANILSFKFQHFLIDPDYVLTMSISYGLVQKKNNIKPTYKKFKKWAAIRILP